jgi:hypothetical protein
MNKTYEKYMTEVSVGKYADTTPFFAKKEEEGGEWGAKLSDDNESMIKLKLLLTKMNMVDHFPIAKKAIEKSWSLKSLAPEERSFISDLLHFFLTAPDMKTFRSMMNKF